MKKDKKLGPKLTTVNILWLIFRYQILFVNKQQTATKRY